MILGGLADREARAGTEVVDEDGDVDSCLIVVVAVLLVLVLLVVLF